MVRPVLMPCWQGICAGWPGVMPDFETLNVGDCSSAVTSADKCYAVHEFYGIQSKRKEPACRSRLFVRDRQRQRVIDTTFER